MKILVIISWTRKASQQVWQFSSKGLVKYSILLTNWLNKEATIGREVLQNLVSKKSSMEFAYSADSQAPKLPEILIHYIWDGVRNDNF